MALTVRCTNPACGKRLRVKDELAGKRIKCPACTAAVLVTAETASPPAVKGGVASRKAEAAVARPVATRREPLDPGRKPSAPATLEAVAGVATSGTAAVVGGLLGGAVAVVASLLMGAVVFALVLLVIALANSILSGAGLMLNPGIPIVVVTILGVLGVVFSVAGFFALHNYILECLHGWGLKNEYPELTCLIAVEAVIGAGVAAVWVFAGSGLVLTLATIVGCLAALASPLVVTAGVEPCSEGGRRPPLGWLGVRDRLWGPRFVRMQAERDLEGLIAALGRPAEGFKIWAAEVLGDLGDARAIPALREILKVNYLSLTCSAKVALVKVGDPEAMELLLASMTSDNNYERDVAREAVISGGIADPVRKALEALLTSESPDQKKRFAKLALRELDPATAKPAEPPANLG